MGNSTLLGRRQFLQGVVPAVTLGTLGIPACSDNSRTSASSNYAPTYFNTAEWTFINAAVGRLIPSEGEGPDGADAGVPEFIDRQMELPYGHGAYFYLKGPFLENSPPTLGYQLRHTPREIHRLGIAAANSAARKSQSKDFPQLSAAEQDRFLAAMYAVSPAPVPNRRNDTVFPLSMRWPLTFWRWFFASKPKPFAASPGTDSQQSQGAYFVEGLGHCGECHTPRAFAMQMKATTPAGGAAYLSGAVIENFFAPSLRNGGPGTLGAWSEQGQVQFLETGANAQGIAFGSMSDVNALKSGDASKPGARTYLDNCAACHRPDGVGNEQVTPRTARTPAQFTMPRFAWRLSDRDVADVVNFVRTSWGNSAPQVSSADVARTRGSLQRRDARLGPRKVIPWTGWTD
jgi:mono/diheme cytochrome c family protein